MTVLDYKILIIFCRGFDYHSFLTVFCIFCLDYIKYTHEKIDDDVVYYLYEHVKSNKIL